MDYLTNRKEILRNLVKQREDIISNVICKFPEYKEYMDFCLSEVRKVVIILGSARGGTSAFKGVLSNFGNVLKMPGEHRLLFTLLGLNFPDHRGDSEKCTSQEITKEHKNFILKNIFYDCYIERNDRLTDREVEFYGWDWAGRLPLQWPEISFEPEKIVEIVVRFYKENESLFLSNEDVFLYKLLKEFQKNYKEIICEFYDSPVIKGMESLDKGIVRSFYENRTIVEISPFVLLRPRKLVFDYSKLDTLVIKASSDCYRLLQLQSLFQNFHRTYIHLTRNPLSSVNGLLDGWHHDTFGQHDINYLESKYQVNIAREVKDKFSWCFDLYENWQTSCSKSLEEISVNQWCSSHEKILEFKQKYPNEQVLNARFEDFQYSYESRLDLFKNLASALNIKEEFLPEQNIKQPRIINATKSPSIQRWKKRSAQLVNIMKNERVAALCDKFGYKIDEFESWI